MIGDKADGLYNAFLEPKRNVCRALLGRLVHVSPADIEGADTRRRATSQEIGEVGWQIALELAAPEARLLVIGRDLEAGQETAESRPRSADPQLEKAAGLAPRGPEFPFVAAAIGDLSLDLDHLRHKSSGGASERLGSGRSHEVAQIER